MNKIIIITGAAGFIGSCLAAQLNREGYERLWLVDDFSPEAKLANHQKLLAEEKIHRENLQDRLFQLASEGKAGEVACVLHIGARTDTTEFDWSIFQKLNLEYSRMLWNFCAENEIPLIYASSAATYGAGELGFSDSHSIVERLRPLNPYGESKNEFDKWALSQAQKPPFWAGLKFFNVFGPNEYHKGRMASVVFHAFNQIQETGKMKLFRSHNPDYLDGEQARDFIYVKDVLAVISFLMQKAEDPAFAANSGLYNLGSGKARTFLDLVNAVFSGLNIQPEIEFIDTPEDIREKYQYFTQAEMQKLRQAGYEKPFLALESSVEDYLKNYLLLGKRF